MSVPFGILNVHKPTGVTSRRVVDVVKRLVKPAKVGHAGTLDPLASGVLVVCVGPATRLIEYVQRMPKRYTATFLLGRESDTEDIEGEVIEISNPHEPSRTEIETACNQFVGEIQQRPPAYSAVKIAGQRAYALARSGKQVELAARPVTIHSLEVLQYDYPQLILDVRCGSGTYVRSLGRDLARSLGTAAVMSALVRTEIGSFHLRDAVNPDSLDAANVHRHLLSPLRALGPLPKIVLSPQEQSRIRNGLAIRRESTERGETVAVDPQGRLLAILQPRGDHEFGPMLNFAVYAESIAALDFTPIEKLPD